jgi:hypothetical protein
MGKPLFSRRERRVRRSNLNHFYWIGRFVGIVAHLEDEDVSVLQIGSSGRILT